MKVFIDEDLCTGDGYCEDLCPELFEMKGDIAVARTEEIPIELEEECREAVESCPGKAIMIEE
jgi:ferredoxin